MSSCASADTGVVRLLAVVAVLGPEDVGDVLGVADIGTESAMQAGGFGEHAPSTSRVRVRGGRSVVFLVALFSRMRSFSCHSVIW